MVAKYFARVSGQGLSQHRIALADSIMLETAQRRNATLWTQDADFVG